MRGRGNAGLDVASRLIRRPAVPAVALGVVALLVLGLIVLTSATGAARTPGVVEGGAALFAESFRSPGALDPTGDFRWSTTEGRWSLDGTALVAEAVPARLESGRDLRQSYRLGVSWENAAEGGRVDLNWAEGDAWVFRLTPEGYEFVHAVTDEETVVASGKLPEDSAGASVMLTRSADSISVELAGPGIEDRRQVASVDHLNAPTNTGFSLGADKAGVRVARIELELPT